MSSVIKILLSAAVCLGARRRLILFLCLLCISGYFIYNQTTKRLLTPTENVEKVAKMETVPPIERSASIVDKKERKDSFPKQRKLTSPLPFNPLEVVRNYKDLTKDPVFSSFSNWLEEYQGFVCSLGDNCSDHDPRYIRNLLLRGERLSRTRAKVMQKIIIGDPKSAISLGIPEQTAEKLPEIVRRNLEKWESSLANVKTAHSCFSTDHQGCEIRREAKFNDGRHMRVWTFGNRKGIGTVSNMAVWGVSIGQDFAMADSPMRIIEKNDESGLGLFAGNTFTYDTSAERDYFSYLLSSAERRVGQINGPITIQYPVAMGSSNSMGRILRGRYQIQPTPSTFDAAYENAIAANGMLLKIESKEENDYICSLLQGNIAPGFDFFHNKGAPWVWLGATDDENQSGLYLDRTLDGNNERKDMNISASEGTWKWLDGQLVSQTYGNWVNPVLPLPEPSNDPLNPESRNNHAYLNFVTGEWNHTWGPFPAGPRGNPFIGDANQDFERDRLESELPYIIEKSSRWDLGMTSDVSLKGIRKVLVIPARFLDQTEYYYSAKAFTGSNYLQTDQFGNPINAGTNKQPYIPISAEELKSTMDEVREFYLRTTDQELELLPVFAPTVTIPHYEGVGSETGSSPSMFDSEGQYTGPAVWSYGAYSELSLFAEDAVNKVGRESEEYLFNGPAFIGIAEIEVNTTTQTAGDPNGYTIPPTIEIEGGAFINPATSLPHVRFQPAQAEAVLNEEGKLSGIRITEPGAYYFDPDFGSVYDFYGRSIFEYNYTEDDLKAEEDRSPLHKQYRHLCVLLDSNGDGFAEYDLVKPRITINGNGSYDANFSTTVDNICITWVVATTYAFGKKFDEETEEGDGSFWDYNYTPNPGIAWVGTPGSHVAIRSDENGTPSISSRTVAHEIGHNLGLWHDHAYSSKGEHALSDEAEKIEYGNPYSIMGNGEISVGGHFSLPGQTTLYEKFKGKGGFSSGLTQGVDVLEINHSADLNNGLKELDQSIPNLFRIYRSNFHIPPNSLRETSFSVIFPGDPNFPDLYPEELDQNLSWFINEFLGQSNSTTSSSAHDNNRTASDLNVSIPITVVGTGDDANITLHFKKGHSPRLEISNGGRGFHKAPNLSITDPDTENTILINPAWIYEENTTRTATLLNLDEDSRWIRGIRIDANASGGGEFLPVGDEITDQLSQYFLSYRTDSDLHGLNVLLANDPRGKFLPDLESFLIDTTPNTPNSQEDAPLLVGSTFSDYDSDIHVTPIRIKRDANVDQIAELYNEIKIVKEKLQAAQDNRVLYEDNLVLFQNNLTDDIARFQTEIYEIYEEIKRVEDNIYPYIEVAVNIGTTASASAPVFDLFVENPYPKKGQYIELAAIVADGNTANYAYSWFINEKQINNPDHLNQPVILQPFNQPGRQVVRVVVSDMKGGYASKNVIIDVYGTTNSNDDSLLSGTVRSPQGLIQGARVVVEKAPVYDHYVGQQGSLRDSYFPSGLNDPAKLMIDGKVAPTLEFHRGEIHRFYFEESLEGSLTFLEKPEASPPRVSVNMLADPRRSVTNFGGLYVRNPEIRYEMNSTFNSYTTSQTGTFNELINPFGNNPAFNGNQEITTPYAKALMEESNITYGRVGPAEINEFGYLTYGGKGYDRDSAPVMQVRRDSIWENYNNSNATARAYIDGVGTISPVNSVDPKTGLSQFLSQVWETRKINELNGTKLPELVVWGSGGDQTGEEPDMDVNASVIVGKDEYRHIIITNQGQGYEPDGTMAVLHYPIEPYAYWTFDRHESLFENNTSSRYQPSPVWNRQFFFNDLLHRWTFDEENGTVVANVDKDLNYTVPFGDGLNSDWGLRGRALDWNGTEVINFTDALPDDNVTVSFWARPRDEFSISLGNNSFTLNHSKDDNDTNVTNGVTALSLVRANPQFNEWVHFAVSYDKKDKEISLSVDGRVVSQPFDINMSGDLNITSLDGLLDELLIFDRVLEEPALKYLAGRTYLDISKNKFHIVPMTDNLIPVTPGQSGSSNDVPSDASFLPEAVSATSEAERLGKLGDTFIQEGSGHSLLLNGSTDHLDLSPHIDEFALAEGTISLWVKVPQQFNENLPLLWLSKPFSSTDINVTDPISGNSTIITEFDPGQYFSMDIQNGWPRIGGYIVLGLENKVNLSGEWHHVVGSFPSGKMWIDGEEVETAPYDGQGVIYEATSNPLEFIFDADTFWVGQSWNVDQEFTNHYQGGIDDLAIYDRELTNEEIYFLYELRRGREQIPRLEAIVDAVGTVEILDAGFGYRENPKLVFGYEQSMDKQNIAITATTLTELEISHTENNTQHGDLAVVELDNQGHTVDRVYSFHMGANPDANYTFESKWRKSGHPNGWRKHISAVGLGEYENAALGDVVWTKRLSLPAEITLRDGNTTKRRFVEYVSIDPELSSSSEINGTDPRISITNGGSGYSQGDVNIGVTGGSGTGMTVDFDVQNTLSIDPADVGVGYTSHGIDVPVTTLTGTGSGMTVDFNISEDKLTKKGVGYTSDGVDVNATNITAGPVNWVLVDINITKDVLVHPGEGYTFTGSPVELIPDIGVTGTGMEIIFQVDGTADGKILGFEITNHGSGYLADDILQIPGGTPGEPPATIRINRFIKSVVITDRGNNLHNPGDVLEIPGGDPVVGDDSCATITIGSFVTDVKINQSGTGYIDGDKVEIPGFGETNPATLDIGERSVSGVSVSSQGIDYRSGDSVTIPPLHGATQPATLQINSIPLQQNYFKPNGLYGFVQVPDMNVSEPGVHNKKITEEESQFFKAQAYVLYHIDQDAADSITIVDEGTGMTSDSQFFDLFMDAVNSVKVSGPGYRPAKANLSYSKRSPFGSINQNDFFLSSLDFRQWTYSPKQQWEDEDEPLDNDDPKYLMAM